MSNMVDMDQTKETLRKNNFTIRGNRCIHNPTKKDFYLFDIQRMNEIEFKRFLESKSIYQQVKI